MVALMATAAGLDYVSTHATERRVSDKSYRSKKAFFNASSVRSSYRRPSLCQLYPGSQPDDIHSIYGILTARFLLHLRDWEARNRLRLGQTSVPSIQYRVDLTLHPTGSIFSIDDFGEDPVYVQKQRMMVTRPRAY